MKAGTRIDPRKVEPYAHYPRALAASDGLSDGAKATWSILADFDGPDGCYPSYKTLAAARGTNRWQIGRQIEELVKAGFIAVERTSGDARKRTFVFLWHPALEAKLGDNPSPKLGDKSARRKVTNRLAIGDKSARLYKEDPTSYPTIDPKGASGGGGKPQGSGAQEQQTAPPPPLANTRIAANWTTDQTYAVLIGVWKRDHPDAIDVDFERNYKHWVPLKPEQQKRAIERLDERIRLGMVTSTTLGYWLREDWQRPVLEPRRPSKREDKVTRIAREARERAARGEIV